MTAAAHKATRKTRTVLKASDFKARALAVMRRVHDTGEAVIVTSHGRALVRIEPAREEKAPTGYGCMKGRCQILDPDLDAPVAPPGAWETSNEWEEDRRR
jgi:prevent-host-death family protein